MRRRAADGTEHLFLLNHTTDEVTVDLGSGLSQPVDLLADDPQIAATGRLRLPPYGVAVVRDVPRNQP
ncbi:Beta-galactosidase C-terminal domain [Streptomyces adelaidensis]|uniref:Beta-galactosidase C-terminal domain n=1 Tax=Streptomyces adelaidensis TaxID=2796465 RepID=UPI0027DDF938|nr:Beta-galactosidase C-terminal domain [Streptomyces adelaidensis]